MEKTARGTELSAVKRALSKDAIVIADDLNYIKGFRYQLWCEAKAAGTTCCTVHCAARQDEVERWNRARRRQWTELRGEYLSEEDGDTDTADGHGENNSSAKTVLPESHTAIYGDRIPDISPRPRSSSMDTSDGGETVPRPSTFMAESIKSFSLANQSSVPGDETSSQVKEEFNGHAGTTSEEPSEATIFKFPPPDSPPYSSKTLNSLLMRYEPPSPFSNWDTPLFTVPSCDLTPPVSTIWNALFPARSGNTSRKGGVSELRAEIKPHAATVLPEATGADALQVLERVTADVVAQVVAQVKEYPEKTDEGGEVIIKFADTVGKLSVPAGTALSLPKLQRLRRTFTQMQRGGVAHCRGFAKGEKAAGEAFLGFLNGEIGI